MSNIKWWHWLLIGVVLIVLVWFLFFRESGNETADDKTTDLESGGLSAMSKKAAPENFPLIPNNNKSEVGGYKGFLTLVIGQLKSEYGDDAYKVFAETTGWNKVVNETTNSYGTDFNNFMKNTVGLNSVDYNEYQKLQSTEGQATFKEQLKPKFEQAKVWSKYGVCGSGVLTKQFQTTLTENFPPVKSEILSKMTNAQKALFAVSNPIAFANETKKETSGNTIESSQNITYTLGSSMVTKKGDNYYLYYNAPDPASIWTGNAANGVTMSFSDPVQYVSISKEEYQVFLDYCQKAGVLK